MPPKKPDSTEGGWFFRTPEIKHAGPYLSQEQAWVATYGHDGYPVRGAEVFWWNQGSGKDEFNG